MAQTAVREEEAFELSALIALLSESYTASYRGSSLKVRRRYRKLIVALTKAQVEMNVKAEFKSRKQMYGVSSRD
jgi:hypothetical protein